MINPITAIKLFFAAQSSGKEIIEGANKMDGLKTGWKTSEFWFGLVLPKLILFITMAQHVLPPVVWAWATTAVAVTYVLGRSALKVVALIAAARAGDAGPALTEVNAQTAVVNK